MFIELFQAADLISILSTEAIAALAISVVLPVFLVSLLSFIPATIELKRPRDAGPRVIADVGKTFIPHIITIDSEKPLIALKPMPKFSVIFPLLSNLET
ncbi:hypothetical protein GX563_07200 [Candidatus Bathyarchaeota archaeon]|nr:hypothetical protein [Candidatus Bathyarchaeota archaeon]